MKREARGLLAPPSSLVRHGSAKIAHETELTLARRRLRWPKFGRWLTRGTASVAAKVVDENRSRAWLAAFEGHPESGRPLSPKAARWHAYGLLLAALRMRLRRLAQPFWVPIDWLLATANRTNGFITVALGTLAVYLQSTGGLHSLVTDGGSARRGRASMWPGPGRTSGGWSGR